MLDGVHRERADRVGHQGGRGGRRSRHVESGERVEETGHGGIRKLGRRSFPARGAAPDGREADGAYGRGCKARHFNRWPDISLVGA
ncbi:spermidine synthase domain protein [Burkholderia cepacia]|nr:spermidine synthase domain protein [Burkholderia cepacia]QOH34087.1 spermidine synthase domain protein [Burkholderia cepacia]